MIIVYNISIENIHLKPKPENNKNGILTFLDYQMKNWTEKHLKIKQAYKILQTPFFELLFCSFNLKKTECFFYNSSKVKSINLYYTF